MDTSQQPLMGGYMRNGGVNGQGSYQPMPYIGDMTNLTDLQQPPYEFDKQVISYPLICLFGHCET